MPSLLTTTRIIEKDAERVGAWMQAHGAGTYRHGAACIGLERDGQLVAGVSYDWYNGSSIYCNIAINGPISREWLWFISYFPFIQLGCNVVIGLIAEGNARSRRFTEHFGFKEVAYIPDADPSGGTFIYAIRKQDCKWLRRRRHGQ